MSQDGLAKASPTPLVSIASGLALTAGVTGLISAYFQAQLALNATFWLRLLIGAGSLFSGILQVADRIRRNRKIKASMLTHQE
jgi:hypothetical protein